MKLLLRRDQKKGKSGQPITFTLDARAELTPQEAWCVKKYKMEKTMLYANQTGWRTMAVSYSMTPRIAVDNAANITVTVEDLVNGKHLECKDIVQMCAVEEQLKDASRTFKEILAAASRLGGEEAIEL